MFKKLLGSEKYDVDNPPSCYDLTKLAQLDLSSVCLCDEMHRKCYIEDSGSRIGPEKPNVTISFKRDDHGKLDLINGSYSKRTKICPVCEV